MEFENELQCRLLIDSLKKNGTQKRRYIKETTEKMDPKLFDIYNKAVEQKREGKYDESLSSYFEVINNSDETLSVDLCRGLAKTLCAANEYDAAFSLLLMCTVYTIDTSIIGQNDSRLLNSCAMDCALIAMGIKKASEGEPEMLMQRTKDISGNPSYSFAVSPDEIIEKAKGIVEGKDNKFFLPENIIERFLEWPVIQAFFAEEYTYGRFL